MNKKAIQETLNKFNIRSFVMLTIAGIINAFGVTLFLFPVKLYDSGISGLSMLLDQVTPSYLTLSIFLLVLNIPIFIFGLKRQGLLFTIYSIYTVAIYSIMSYLTMDVLPINVSLISPLAGSDLLLCYFAIIKEKATNNEVSFMLIQSNRAYINNQFVKVLKLSKVKYNIS